MERNYEDFLSVVQTQVLKQDWSWFNLIKAFDFLHEHRQILNFLNSQGKQDADPLAEYITMESKNQILRQLALHEGAFDLETILDYYRHISVPSLQPKPTFESFYLNDKERVINFYKHRFLN